MLSSCDLDINQDPNYATGAQITPELQFPSVISAIADASGDQMFNYGGFFAQYFEQMPEANQYNDLAELNIDESKDIFNRCYRNLYAGALMDIEDIKTKTSNPADLFACQVMRTLAFQLLVDNTSETPYTEALQSASNSSPKYDDGKTVYEGVLAELDAAEAALTGNVKWDVFSDLEGQYNPWYQSVFRLTQNHCAAYPIVSYMQNNDDPRLSYIIKPRESDGTYVGQFPGSKQNPEIVGTSYKNKDVSTIDYSITHDMPIYLFTQSELQFLIAEVQMRFGNNEAAAKSAYETGVKADFSLRGTAGADSFLAKAGAFAGTQAEKLNLIYMQKWTALFMHDHMEAWSEIRRTDVPALSPHSAAQIKANPTIYTPGNLINPSVNKKGGSNIAMSMPYSSDSRKYNVNTPATARQITDKVFWDVK